MSFMESPRFPENISYGVAFGPEFVTVVAKNQGGYESRNRGRARGLCRGNCAHAIRTKEELAILIRFFRSVGGRFSGFRFKDWSDYQLAEADSLLSLVSGTVNQLQINKLYQAAAGYAETRPLRKPVAGTLVLKDAGTPVVAGAGAGQYSLDTTTGIVTLVASQTRTISSHLVGATHRFTLASALSPAVSIGQKVAVSGITGTAANLLNGLRHTVTAVSGANVTVATNTTGLTASGGTLLLYRQDETLTASCEFDTPARFDTDHMAASIESVAAQTWDQIPIQEIRT
jgi:uncharacterized protein (TIGR02217 family)